MLYCFHVTMALFKEVHLSNVFPVGTITFYPMYSLNTIGPYETVFNPVPTKILLIGMKTSFFPAKFDNFLTGSVGHFML